MNILRTLGLICLLLLASQAHGEGQAYECGSDISQYFVPNKPLGFKFVGACVGHDVCYEKCEGAGADLKEAGGQCDQEPMKKESRRGICDSRFYETLIRECLSEYFKKTCEFLAKVYTVTVRFGGKGSFNGQEIQRLVRVLQAEPSYDISALNQGLDKLIREGKNISGQKLVLSAFEGGASLKRVGVGAVTLEDFAAGRSLGTIQIDPTRLSPAELRQRIERFQKAAPNMSPDASPVGSPK